MPEATVLGAGGHTSMKQVILKQLNMEKYKRRELEEQPDTSDQEPSQDGGNDQQLGLEFSDSLYDDAEQEIQSIWKSEDIKEYNFDTTGLVTLKAARMSKEAKAPFAIIKNRDKKARATEFDDIYEMNSKIKYSEYKQGMRLGFIRAADDFQYDNCNVSDERKIVGVANDRFPIHKKKGFNQKKVGYIKLAENTDTKEYYVEVTKSRGVLWIVLWALIIAALVILLSNLNMSGWQFNWSNLSFYKTEVQDIYTAEEIGITHRAETVLRDGQASLELMSDTVEGLEYQIKIYDINGIEKTQIYESDMLKAGEGITTIKIDQALSNGEHTCQIECDVYRDTGVYIGQFTSQFNLLV